MTASHINRQFRVLGVLLAAAESHGSAPTLEEITVTARKQVENLREVPLTIDVFGEDALRRGSIDGSYAIAARVPGVSFSARYGGALASTVMRGQAPLTLTGDNVGIFVDGVYQANIDLRNIEMLDIARVEVVRGPQSTLFGHSTFAGAIHHISAQPTAAPAGGFALEGGSDRYNGAQGWISGPLFGPLLARFAVGARAADGTHRNNAPGGGSLDDFERRAAALTLSTGGAFEWTASLSLRYTGTEAGQAAFNTIDYTDFNCGGRVPSPAAWSYYCGDAPVRTRFDLSPNPEDMEGDARQAALALALPVRGLSLESDTSWYRGSFTTYRDEDGSSAGTLFGVCRPAILCGGVIGGAVRVVDRLVRRDIVTENATREEEFAQELRLVSAADARVEWMIGVYGYRSEFRMLASSGVARGDLAADEVLTAYLPAEPLTLGPVSILNRALVDDPLSTRPPRNGAEERRRNYGAFAAVSVEPGEQFRLRTEARFSRERVERTSRYDSFRVSIGNVMPAERFSAVTPRFSVEYNPSSDVRWYLSHAKGFRSGGINPLPGLIEEEQRYDPETNWTTELGLRVQRDGLLRSLDLTAFHIDWQNTQIQGLSNTPGVATTVIRNTAGVETRGIESRVEWQLAPWLGVDLAYTWIDAEYRKGSDSPGDRAFCGINAQNPVSSFCTVGPSRVVSAAGPAVVPYIDGNAPPRFADQPWHLGVTVEPPGTIAGWHVWLRADLGHQGDMSDLPVGGLSYGARTLLDVRTGATRNGWSVELWVKNLTNAHYIATTVLGYSPYYPTQPRPVDLVHGEGRRMGITLRRSLGIP